MSEQDRTWRLRVAFEPNRFAKERLAEVYARLKPPESRAVVSPPSGKIGTRIRRAVKGDGQ
jgi:hypothetical protein